MGHDLFLCPYSDPLWGLLFWLELGSPFFVSSFLPLLDALFNEVCQGFILSIQLIEF